VALKYAKNDAMTDYLQAILNARMGKNEEARKSLNSALKKDPSLGDYAARDLELINIR
jgi:Tfp pilus assembly protein PilF